MAADNDSLDLQSQLLKQIETLTDVNQKLLQTVQTLALQVHALSSTEHTDPSLPPPVAAAAAIAEASFPPIPGGASPTINRPRRRTSVSLDVESFRRSAGSGENPAYKASIFTDDSSSEDDSDEASFYVQQTLTPETFDKESLFSHIENHSWGPEGRMILDDILKDGHVDREASFHLQEGGADQEHHSHHHIDVYDVGADGATVAYYPESSDHSEGIWQCLCNVNDNPRKERKAVGRITIAREPAPLLFGALHLTMKDHFDIDEILRFLVDPAAPSKAYMKGCMSNDHRQQRSFVFCFKYHCLVDDGREPMIWQKADDDLKSTKEHIPISSCSSIVALSLSGTPIKELRRRSRKKKIRVGQIYDPFAPWRVLSLQCYPDWDSTVEHFEQNKHFVNGTEAFLYSVLAEYKDATKRFKKLTDRIAKLVTPPAEFMFNSEARDKLLFEDKDFTCSRRYFWAFQTLGTMIDDIEAMINTYKENFTNDVWSGESPYIWPGTKDVSSRHNFWRKKMEHTQRQFEKTIAELKEVVSQNKNEQKDIKSLRDQLFSGTSVRESREAIMQNDNIKLLTLVTVFFLPLTFVTSVFGMTNLPDVGNFNLFGIVTVTVCIPTYLFIYSLTVENGVERYARIWKYVQPKALLPQMELLFLPKGSARAKKKREELAAAKSATHPRRRRERSLSTYEGAAKSGGNQSHSRQDLSSQIRQSAPHPTTAGDRALSVTFEERFTQNGEAKRPRTATVADRIPMRTVSRPSSNAPSVNQSKRFRGIAEILGRGQDSQNSHLPV